MRILDSDGYIIELKKKLCEEAKEVYEANSKEEIIEEIGDVLEVIEAVRDAYLISDSEIQMLKEIEAEMNGRFQQKIYLEYVIEKEK